MPETRTARLRHIARPRQPEQHLIRSDRTTRNSSDRGRGNTRTPNSTTTGGDDAISARTGHPPCSTAPEARGQIDGLRWWAEHACELSELIPGAPPVTHVENAGRGTTTVAPRNTRTGRHYTLLISAPHQHHHTHRRTGKWLLVQHIHAAQYPARHCGA